MAARGALGAQRAKRVSRKRDAGSNSVDRIVRIFYDMVAAIPT